MLYDGRNEKRSAEHELVRRTHRLAVGGEVHHERTHHRVALGRAAPRRRVDVRHEGVAELHERDERVVHGLARLAADITDDVIVAAVLDLVGIFPCISLDSILNGDSQRDGLEIKCGLGLSAGAGRDGNAALLQP